MADPTVTRRLARAKTRAADMLRGMGYGVVHSDNSTFCVLGVRNREIRMVRVVIDKITEEDKTRVAEFPQKPPNCTREIWCKRHNISGFEMMEIN